MRRAEIRLRLCTPWVALALGVSVGCGTSPRADLEAVVQRDLLVFEGGTQPAAFVERLAAERVVAVGEMHHTDEHNALLASLVPSLQVAGLRQVLFEWNQADDWLFGAYAQDRVADEEWRQPTWYNGDILKAIRTVNRAAEAGERVQAGCIDMNFGGAQVFTGSLERLTRHIPSPAILEALLRDYPAGSAEQETRLQALQAELRRSRDDLVSIWGQAWYDAVVAAVDAELASIPIRRVYSSDEDRYYRQREELIKRLVEGHLAGVSGLRLINIGSYHVQKKRVRGTDQEWLGGYLVNRSPLASGRTMTLAVIPARGEAQCGDTTVAFDIARDADEDDLVRIVIERANGRTVALFLDDPLFVGENVKITDPCNQMVAHPKDVDDALVVLPEGHLER